MRVVLGLATSALYCAWLWLFDVDLIVVWALVSFLLNFIPTIGSIVAGSVIVLYTFITRDLGTAAAVGAGILVIEQIMGNYVDPKLAGRSIALSPLVVMVALIFWGWVWGIAGALLAVPMTTVLVVIGAHIPATRPLALLLTDRTSMKGLDDATTAS